jgi:NADH-quinone oxidoreductase subunit E
MPSRMPRVSVYEVGSFYSMFALQPVGRHKVSVCNNISCMLVGADSLLGHIQVKYGVKPGETTRDGRFTLVKEEECLAACCGGPMMVVDGHYHENLTIEKLDEILGGLE